MNYTVWVYLLCGFVLIWLFAFLSYFITKRKQKKYLQTVRLAWGKPVRTARNFDLIENFASLTTSPFFHQLTAQTIADIDLRQVFEFIDRTNCKPGQQYLFNKLIKPANNIEALKVFDKQVNFFSENVTARESTQLILSSLNHNDAYYITNLLDEELLKQPAWYIFYVIDTVAVITMLLSAFKFPVLLIWLMIPLAINMFLYFRNKNTVARFSRSFPQLNNLITVSKILLKKELPFEKITAQKSVAALKSFQRKYKLLNFGQGPKDEITQTLLFIAELLKAFFLIELHSFFSCLKELKNKKEHINNLLNHVGCIDAALSTASLRGGIGTYTTPVFTAVKKELVATDMYHPLIEDCVTNSITVKDKSILITGSNMSGKSTFIRTVAINAILAQTIYTCFAKEFTLPVLKVFSSIRITDNLQDAKSYYFEEVNVIGSLINESQTTFQHLFILDEVFKGTNTIERVAAAKAILSYLNKNNNIVFVSTHDIELSELLLNEFDLYHFVEDIENDKLVFDHQLKTGTLKTRNAIKLLALSNYPAEIIEAAKTIANKN